METPVQYLPGTIPTSAIQTLLASIDLPEAASIEPLNVAAAFHAIYILKFSPENVSDIHPVVKNELDGSASLVLRISGNHLPQIKTANEVAVMKWVAQHTSIPVPAIIRFDVSSSNAVGHEFTLLAKIPGVSVDELYDSLDDATKRSLVAQLANYIGDLHSHTWNFVGGLQLSRDGSNVVGGPVVDETFWQAPDILKYWDSNETITSLNVQGPYDTYTDFVAASIDRYIYAINKHDSLSFMRNLVPRLENFIALLKDKTRTKSLGLDNARLVLAHKDMHFANIMVDPSTYHITGILDWEFAGVVPATRWNPVRAFLWSARRTPESKQEHTKMEQILEQICAEQGIEILAEAKMTSLQDAMQKIANFVRAIVEVSPKGQRKEDVPNWRNVAETALEAFGI